MNNLKIIQHPNKILRFKAKRVTIPITKQDEKIIQKMIYYIDESQKEDSQLRPGVGIAAPQIGYSKKMFYINFPKINDNTPQVKYFLINPEIIKTSNKWVALKDGEGCLSINNEKIKGTSGLVHRKQSITIKGYSYFDQKEITITKDDYHAIVLQHEFDHLIGKLFIDHIDQKNPWKEKTNEKIL